VHRIEWYSHIAERSAAEGRLCRIRVIDL